MPFPLLAAIAPALGGLAGAVGSIMGGREANAASAQSAQKQMDFQAVQSATAHQREAADLEKAGLNRALTLGGQGAVTGAGASYAAQNPMQGMASTAQSAIQSVFDLKKQDKEIELLDAQAHKTANEAKITDPQAAVLGRLGSKVQSFIDRIGKSSAQDKKAERRENQIQFQNDTNEEIRRQERKRRLEKERAEALRQYKQRNNLP